MKIDLNFSRKQSGFSLLAQTIVLTSAISLMTLSLQRSTVIGVQSANIQKTFNENKIATDYVLRNAELHADLKSHIEILKKSSILSQSTSYNLHIDPTHTEAGGCDGFDFSFENTGGCLRFIGTKTEVGDSMTERSAQRDISNKSLYFLLDARHLEQFGGAGPHFQALYSVDGNLKD